VNSCGVVVGGIISEGMKIGCTEGFSSGGGEPTLFGDDVITILIGSIVMGSAEGKSSVALGIEVDDGRSIANGAGESGAEIWGAFGRIL
jgi:hypothetical protein